MTTTIDINGVPISQLSQLIELAKAGQEIILAEGDKPVARLTAIETAIETAAQTPFESAMPAPKKRIAGLGRGTMTMSADFDEPLPDSFWLGEE